MSKNRAGLKSALRSLDVSKPLRIPPQLGFTAPQPSQALEPLTPPRSSHLTDSLSKSASVNSGHRSSETLSNLDSVQFGMSKQEIVQDFKAKDTVSKLDTIKDEQRHPTTVSKSDSVTTSTSNKTEVRSTQRAPFTAVPNFLLREEGRFTDPLDFMIFLHLFTYSHGFGRNEASMSQAQLERFTRSAKNTVKRSMERLLKQGLIKCVEEYEYARMSRRFQINLPSASGANEGKVAENTGLKPDSVQRGQCADLPGSPSKFDSVRVSKIDTYKDSIPKEKSKNSLSPKIDFENIALRQYFTNLKPIKKRERESFALKGLKQDYSEAEIGSCLEHLLTHGIPGSNEPCHSPLAFLMNAMDQVLVAVTKRKQKNLEKQNALERRICQDKLNENEMALLNAELDHREEAFLKAFPTPELQREFILRQATGFPGFDPEGPIVRNFVINAWWDNVGP